MSHLNLTLSNLEDTLKAEAGPVVAELACRVIVARTNNARPKDESMAAQSVRGMMRGDFQARITQAMSEEERSVAQVANALGKAQGPALDGVGGGMGIARNASETDEDYTARLEAANDLEAKPIRTAIRKAGEALADTLLKNPGPVLDLVTETATEMGKV